MYDAQLSDLLSCAVMVVVVILVLNLLNFCPCISTEYGTLRKPDQLTFDWRKNAKLLNLYNR